MAYAKATNRLGIGVSSPSSRTTELTTSGFYDAAYVESAICVYGRWDTTGIIRFDFDAALSDFWLHWDFRMFGSTPSADNPYVILFDAADQPVVKLHTPSNGLNMAFSRWTGSAWVEVVRAPNLYDSSTNRSFDIYCKTGVSGEVSFHINNSQELQYSGALPVANITHARLYSRTNVSDMTISSCFSQLMVSTTDTRTAKFRSRRANGNGAHTDGIGAYGDIDDLPVDQTTLKLLNAAGQIATFTSANQTAVGGMAVEAVVVNALMRASGGVVNNAKAVLRIGGTDYKSANISPPPNAGFLSRGAVFVTNPATGTPFTQTSVNGVEFGFEGVA